MAKVTFVLEDADGGGFTLSLESNPPFPGPAASPERRLTPAQKAAFVALASLKDLGEATLEQVEGG